ncbi:type II toxin-antitoxin system RelE/ParE family toxin [Lactiplantibacillus plantarum]|uniref:type II toxin-antitoxin system RelE/ParE family toxin n=1 Tax=Lactiplantibacillus plantarum TaxID=1590 RepID=UPI00280A7F2B|nr:type II toxin-antitoxin system RelE/ParE family toxin [Lactiplantibacillus plantarum]
MEKPEFETYKRPNGHDEFDEWLQQLLQLKDRAKALLQVITDTQDQGLPSRSTHDLGLKKIESAKNLYELRSKVSSNIQRALYFHVKGPKYVITTHGFTKKTQKTPPAEIKHAIELRTEWEDSQNENQ